MQKAVKMAYKQLLNKLIKESRHREQFKQKAFADNPEFVHICHKFDFEICRNLLADGYTIKNIQEVLIEFSPYGRLFDNPDKKKTYLRIYCDEILENIKKDKVFHSGKTFELVQEQYIKSIGAIK